MAQFPPDVQLSPADAALNYSPGPVMPGPQLGAPPVMADPNAAAPQAPAAPPVIVYPSAPVQAPGPVPGGIRATPQQATAGFLGNLQSREQLSGQKGDLESEGQKQVADLMGQAASEKINQANDYKQSLDSALLRQQRFADQGQQAFSEFQKAARESGQDPTKAFWADKSTPTRILSGLAAFSSGLGSGLLGKGGNPYLDYLNKEIERNFEAHKGHINDLYNTEVASGRLQDNDMNRGRFEDQGKLAYYQLAAAHIVPQLEQIAATTNSGVVKLTAQQAIADLKDQEINTRQNLSHNEAAQAAAALAQQRARQKEARDFYQKSLSDHKDLGPDMAREAAIKDMLGAGFDRSVVSPIADAAGVPYDPGTGKYRSDLQMVPGSQYNPQTGLWSVPASTEGENLPPHVGAVWNPDTATWTYKGSINDKPLQARGGTGAAETATQYDPGTGKPYTPEEKAAQKALVVQTPNGPRLGNSKEDADDARIMASATDDLEKGVKRIKEIEAKFANSAKMSGDERQNLVGEYDTITKDMVTRYNAAAQGVKRATGQGESHLLSEDAIPVPPSTVGAATDTYWEPRVKQNAGKIIALENIIKNNRQGIEGYLQPPAKIVTQPGAPKPKSQAEIDDLIRKAGGKKVE